MDLKECTERLDILLNQKVISPTSYEITLLLFKFLQTDLGKEDLAEAEMLFTHLPMALTRIENGEDIQGPPQEILREVRESEYFKKVEGHLGQLEQTWGKKLPQEETEFLYIHYINVFNSNK